MAPFTANRALIKSFIHYATVLHFFRKKKKKKRHSVCYSILTRRSLAGHNYLFFSSTYNSLLLPKVISLLFYHQKSFTFLFTFYTNFENLSYSSVIMNICINKCLLSFSSFSSLIAGRTLLNLMVVSSGCFNFVHGRFVLRLGDGGVAMGKTFALFVWITNNLAWYLH